MPLQIYHLKSVQVKTAPELVQSAPILCKTQPSGRVESKSGLRIIHRNYATSPYTQWFIGRLFVVKTNVFVVFYPATLSNWFVCNCIQLYRSFVVSHNHTTSVSRQCKSESSICTIIMQPTTTRAYRCSQRLIGPLFVVATCVVVVSHPAT